MLDTDPITLMFLVLIVAMLLIGLWSALSRGHLDNLVAIGRPVVGNLFLKVPYRGKGDGVHDAYLRTLGVDKATFVTRGDAPAKGDLLTMELGGLPNFPQGDATTQARVQKVEILGPGSCLVTVHFDYQPSKSPLDRYVTSLARTGRYSPA